MSTPSDQQAGHRHTAGAYDVRTVIAGLIGLYGLVLTVLGIVDFSDADKAKTGDVNANLWAGIGMLVFSLAVVLWARLRPVVVDPAAIPDEPDAAQH
jgi:uncharacterized membrane protein YidH (DUF202 family)